MAQVMDAAEIARLRERATSIKFCATPEDARLLDAIGKRAHDVAARYFKQTRGRDMGPADLDVFQVTMDVANVHLNGRPLHLLRFLLSDESDFAHDIGLIHRFVDRRAGGIPAGVSLLFAQSSDRPAGA